MGRDYNVATFRVLDEVPYKSQVFCLPPWMQTVLRLVDQDEAVVSYVQNEVRQGIKELPFT